MVEFNLNSELDPFILLVVLMIVIFVIIIFRYYLMVLARRGVPEHIEVGPHYIEDSEEE